MLDLTDHDGRSVEGQQPGTERGDMAFSTANKGKGTKPNQPPCTRRMQLPWCQGKDWLGKPHSGASTKTLTQGPERI